MWFKAFRSVATFLGLISAGIAIALKELVTDMAGWVFIMLEGPLINYRKGFE